MVKIYNVKTAQFATSDGIAKNKQTLELNEVREIPQELNVNYSRHVE